MARRQSLNRLVLLVASLTGCSSRSTELDDVDLFFRFSVDGTPVEFTSSTDVYGLFAQCSNSSGESLQIAAWDLETRVGLTVSSYQTVLGTGTYSIARSVDDPTFQMLFYYGAPDGTDYFAEPVVPEDATLVISRVASNAIDGTFYGVLKAEGHPDVIITNGEFTVRREFDQLLNC